MPRSSAPLKDRCGFTLVELLVLTIVGSILAGMLLPAIQSVRESSRRLQCANNTRQLGIGILGYESAHRLLPTAGEGIDSILLDEYLKGNTGEFILVGRFTNGRGQVQDSTSPFLLLLPYIEQTAIYDVYDFEYEYMDQRASRDDDGNFSPEHGNVGAARTDVPTYMCPSNPLGNVDDPQGFGRLDYFASSYTDISPGPQEQSTYAARGTRDRRSSQEGGLNLAPSSLTTVLDGVSNTAALIEDAGRSHITQGWNTASTRRSPTCVEGFGYGCAMGESDSPSDQSYYTVHRWADPDAAGGGVSGPPYSRGIFPNAYINQSKGPMGGPNNGSTIYNASNCPWSKKDCGPNEEPFSFHLGGLNLTMLDGSTHFLSESIDGVTLRYLITKSEQSQPRRVPFE